jgi:predicted aldo/keto reductase-like oxidoreductase
MGSAGISAVFASSAAIAAGPNKPNAGDSNAPEKEQKPQYPQVPKRKLGRTGIEVPSLALGVGAVEGPVVFREALKWGISYWDTSYVAAGGNSELGIGKYLSDNPDIREQLFIVTKESQAKTAADLEKCLQNSLARMNTKYIDLYVGVYMMSEPAQLTDELKQWAESAKERKLIRFFGLSTHKNMAQCLAAAAKLDWIDAIITAYNFRLMQDSEMQAAIEACHKAGIGLIAIKTQGMGQKAETEEDKKLVDHFKQRGFTEGQAKIKAVLEDKRISSACVLMSNVAVLISNIAAVLDKTKLTESDMAVFKRYAKATCDGYCTGCAHICDLALPEAPYISDIMRYLMYYKSYGDQVHARQLFAQIPANVVNRLLNTDYRDVEACCPQHLPIGKLVTEAISKLA